jgi:ELWxxDGT repeat protein
VGKTLFFSAGDEVHGEELWKTDGTAAGTVLVKDIRPGPADSIPIELEAVGNLLYFLGPRLDTTYGLALWRSDGTTAGTRKVAEPILRPSGAQFWDHQLTEFNGLLFFWAEDATGIESLWRSDGTPEGTFPLLRLFGGGHRPFAESGGALYFAGVDPDDPTDQGTLWKTDGTAAGTVPVRRINSGPDAGQIDVANISWLTDVGGTLFFGASDGVAGLEPWKSNGTSAGTALVADLAPGVAYSSPSMITALGNRAIFWAYSDPPELKLPWRLWASDGATTTDLGGRSYDRFASVFTHGTGTYFTGIGQGAGAELWRTNGTAPGTHLFRDINPGPADSGPAGFASLGNLMFFGAVDGRGGAEPWVSEGTALGTIRAGDVRPGPDGSYPRELTAVGKTLFFRADDGSTGDELWKAWDPAVSDGTTGSPTVPPGSGGGVSPPSGSGVLPPSSGQSGIPGGTGSEGSGNADRKACAKLRQKLKRARKRGAGEHAVKRLKRRLRLLDC